MTSDLAKNSNRVAFCVSPELMTRAEASLQALRRDPEHPSHVKELVAVVLELTENGLDYYFLEPLRRARVGAMGMAPARLGIATAGRAISPLVRRVMSSLDKEQILSIADFVDELLIPDSEGSD
jgi:hypothetical protein